MIFIVIVVGLHFLITYAPDIILNVLLKLSCLILTLSI